MSAQQLLKDAILSKNAVPWLEPLLKISYLHRYLSLIYTFCYRLPNISVTGTLVTNGLKPNIFSKNFAKLCYKKLVKKQLDGKHALI